MKRVQRSLKKGYKMPENTIFVGGPTKFANPFRLTKDGFIQAFSTNRNILDKWIIFREINGFTEKDIVDLYEIWLKGDLEIEYPFLPKPPEAHEIRELEGKNLSCFCSLNVPCHADVILNWFM